ncbi:MAG: hypothetical protein AMJ92_01605 [candidate division Zixibacteria bacterium SM23_81]|nr:MAG: hypothetical protein AMJ92_01605 [candidate division Zixibacteria bacterium SM23_81]
MDEKETKEAHTQQDRVDFWGGENDDKQNVSLDWSHDGHFWIALPGEKVSEVIAVVRSLLSDKFGGDWPDRPSPRAAGQYLDVKHNHHLFAKYSHKEAKERFAEVHPTETGRTIFVRVWHNLFEETKAAFQARGFTYHPQIPKEHQVRIPGTEITPEKAQALEKFRKSQPLEIPESAFERTRGGSGTLVGVVIFLALAVVALVVLRGHLGKLFVRAEPLELGTFLEARSRIAAFEKMDGSIVYILTDADIGNKLKTGVRVYGDLIDSTRSDFYAVDKLENAEGQVIHAAMEGASFSIPSFAEIQELAEYQVVETENFQYDRKRGWEKLQGEPVVLKGALKMEADGFYLEAGDGLIKLITTDSFTLLNLQIAQKKGKAVTLYGTIGDTFDWKTVRQDTRKMFQFSLVPVDYATLTAF